MSWFLSRLFQLWDVVFSVLVKRVALCERFRQDNHGVTRRSAIYSKDIHDVTYCY